MVGDKVSGNKMAGDKSIRATKWLVTNCTRDETEGDEVSLQRNGWRRNGGDETAATKW